jgi:hypothetical protein
VKKTEKPGKDLNSMEKLTGMRNEAGTEKRCQITDEL